MSWSLSDGREGIKQSLESPSSPSGAGEGRLAMRPTGSGKNCVTKRRSKSIGLDGNVPRGSMCERGRNAAGVLSE